METTKTQERQIDDKLDYLYNSNVRCPYCGTRILKYTTTCTKCGINKKQIAEASNKKAKAIIKAQTGEKIFKTYRRPKDVGLMDILVRWLGGYVGLHCFYVGRNVRGFFMLIAGVIGLLGFVVFPKDVRAYVTDMKLIGDAQMLFPTDWLFVIVFFIWAFDLFAIILGFFKYPVRLGESYHVKK